MDKKWVFGLMSVDIYTSNNATWTRYLISTHPVIRSVSGSCGARNCDSGD